MLVKTPTLRLNGVVADEHVTGISLKPMGHSDLDIGMFESCLSDLLWNVEFNTDVKFFFAHGTGDARPF